MIYDWTYIMPQVEFARDDGEMRFAPKYHENSGILGFSAVEATDAQLSQYYSSVIATNPSVERWCITRFFAKDNPGWTALNGVHANADAHAIATRIDDAVNVLNTTVENDRTTEEWRTALKVENPNW